MKKRTRIVYNCFYPDFENGYDEPIVVRSLRAANRLLLRWGWCAWNGGSVIRQVRHPLAHLAQAMWVLRDPDEFDYRVASRKRRTTGSPLRRTRRAYCAKNMKCNRPEVARERKLEDERREAEERAWQLAHPVPLGKYPLPLANESTNLIRQLFSAHDLDSEEIPF